jgi:DNA-binding CsgD family transcriptional regulator
MAKTLSHYGTPRHSGRYPWGSGDNAYQRNKSFLGYVDDLHKKGMSEVDIAKGLGINTSQLRAKRTIAKAEQRKADVAQALRLKDKGVSNVEIGKRMGINESSVRSLLDPAKQERSDMTAATANMLKDVVAKKGFVDVGLGVENHIGVSRTKLKTAISLLEEEGYKVHYVPVEQLGTGKKTTIMALAKPGVDYQEVYKNRDKIQLITDYSEDGGRSFLGIEPVRSIDSKRIMVRYKEDGGSDRDGVIELRRGVDDVSLGNAKYAQVRVAVNDSHYMKGMAMYGDPKDFPSGVDIIYNTNKSKGTPMLGPKDNTVCKPMKGDPDNPFGSVVRQKHYVDKDGKTQLSSLNIVGYQNKEGSGEEGAWGHWSKSLSSQVLSKQSPSLAKRQLDLAYKAKKEEYDEIMSLTNPAIKKKLLESFSDDCDASAVHLKAAALPRQQSHVILPIPSMKETEIYAPNYRDGEQVVLIRHPHGGTFEIPQLTVNNRQPTAKKLLGDVADAVGIHPKVAEKLSGADFDGDTVLVIPNGHKLIKTSPSLKGLKDFDPKTAYPGYEGMPKLTSRGKGLKMGDVSNLITDMTIKGAPADEIARAVRHSMVVIDAEKHNLNYRQSYIDNNIAQLKDRYQGGATRGASTLVSRASSEVRPDYRTEGVFVTNPQTGKSKKYYVDPETGKKLYTYTNETYTKAKYKDPETGKIKETTLGVAKKKGYEVISTREVKKTVTSSKMAETDDAFTLSSGTPMEAIYATHANKLKALGNQARKDSFHTPSIEYSPSANKTYDAEVRSLKGKLNLAIKNKPLERQAQILANTVVTAKKNANPDMQAEDLKKIKGQALTEARLRVGAKKEQVEISDAEWKAIQAGAVSNNVLVQILNNTDLDKVKAMATPRTASAMTPAKIDKARALLDNGYTRADIADQLGVSTSTLATVLD